jgi:hypothetical protein
MSIVEISASPKQLSKLRNGHRVRIRPAMEGKGVCVVVDPSNYDLITRTFSRNKGLEISLSPQEIVANQDASGEMEGKGIFGKKFDRGLRKLIGKKAQRELYGTAREFLPLAQAGLTAGLGAAGTALGVAQPELIPFIPAGVAGLSALGSNYLANPSSYQSNAGGSRAKLARDLAGRALQDRALQEINAQTGANLGALDRASIEQALVNKARAELNKTAVQQKARLDTQYGSDFGAWGSGLYAGGTTGYGLGLGLGLGIRPRMSRSGGAIGLNGGMVSGLPPALRSQPFSSNFQFQHTLPPAYQRFSKGSGLTL